MFALVDCNNFYASCEKLFDPTLKDRPVVVLSNNDGCAVARSAEAKALGVKMGEPWFKLKELARKHGIVAKSSNYALYADMSDRVVQVLRGYAPLMHVYSIDECFLDMTSLPYDLTEYGQKIKTHILEWVGLPVCVGIAPTMTLAKLANHLAKKRPVFNGVCNLPAMPVAKLEQILTEIEVGEVWGVGQKISARLQAMGVATVAELRACDPVAIRREFSVVMERTVRELQGIPCIELEEAPADKQQIICSRSFGMPICTLEEINEALASYISRACEKLRAQDSVAGSLQVWLHTNHFKPDLPQYSRSVTIPLPTSSNDTSQLIRVGQWAMKRIYRDGYEYKKCGCMLGEIVPSSQVQADLFSPSPTSSRAVKVMDEINKKFGRGAIRSAAVGTGQAWSMRRENLSPAYTTDWHGLMVVR